MIVMEILADVSFVIDREPLLLCFSPETRKVLRKNLKGLNSKQFNKSPVWLAI